MTQRVVRGWVTALVVVAALVACTSPARQQTPDKVTLHLKFVHQAQAAGFYVAQERGYYADENLQVSFVEGGPDMDLVGRVLGGEADFGVDAPEQLFTAASADKAVKAIAVILRKNPMVFITMANSEITRPQDFLGRTLAITGVDMEPQYGAMMQKLGLDTDQVRLLPYAYDASTLISGEADVTVGYYTGSLIRIQQAGYETRLIWPSDYGIHLYGDTLFSTHRLIAENPDRVTRFARASLRGWQDAVEEPEAAVEATLKYAREADRAMQSKMMEASVPLIYTGKDQIGWMRAEEWQEMHDLLLAQGILAGPLNIDKVYTSQFLRAVYGEEK